MLSRLVFPRLRPVRRLTGITRRDQLQPNPDPEILRQMILENSKKVLTEIQRLPEGNEYREAITRLYQYRIEVAGDTSKMLPEIEETLGSGPAFELINAARDEVSVVIPLLLEEKPWELDDNNPIYKKDDPDFHPWERKVLIE